MNRPLKATIIAIATSCLAFAHAQTEEASIDRYRANDDAAIDFKIKPTIEPEFPLQLKSLGYENGSVTVVISINQFGELQDFLLIEATHIAFGKAVEAVLPKWKFSVPHVNGESASISSKIRVEFKRGEGVLYDFFGYRYSNSGFGNPFDRDKSYRIYTLKELDSIPIPTSVQKPLFHTELLEERELVSALFEFYIDTDGNVRIPTLREADDEVDERLLIIAQDALSQWRFEPPLKNGKPVVAKAAQPFLFKALQSQ